MLAALWYGYWGANPFSGLSPNGDILKCGAVITHPNGTADYVGGYFCCNASQGPDGWYLTLNPDDPALGKPIQAHLVSGDTYQNAGSLPDWWLYPDPAIIKNTALPVGTVGAIP